MIQLLHILVIGQWSTLRQPTIVVTKQRKENKLTDDDPDVTNCFNKTSFKKMSGNVPKTCLCYGNTLTQTQAL